MNTTDDDLTDPEVASLTIECSVPLCHPEHLLLLSPSSAVCYTDDAEEGVDDVAGDDLGDDSDELLLAEDCSLDSLFQHFLLNHSESSLTFHYL